MKIDRVIAKEILQRLQEGQKVIVLYGPRQSGKTTLVKEVLSQIDQKILQINGDEQKYIDILSSRDLTKIQSLVYGFDILFIDEAQRIPEIGINLKIMHDHLPKLKIIVTGSSSLELAGKIKEPLTGRTWTYTLFPISVLELSKTKTDFYINDQLENHLIYGMYPDIITATNLIEKQRRLNELANAYLYKDILEIGKIKSSQKLRNLLQLLAYQIGSEVSYHELGQKLSMSKETVAAYIDLLEKCFIVFQLSGFSRNLRNEITRMHKIYFYDIGLRNMIIDNFKPLQNRDDHGQLWENFIIAERRKTLSYTQYFSNTYFWRIYSGAEIDYVEDHNGELAAYEIKYGSKKKIAPETWQKTYPQAIYKVINPENYLDFICRPNH